MQPSHQLDKRRRFAISDQAFVFYPSRVKQFLLAVIAVILSILVDLILPPLPKKIVLNFQMVENSGDYGIDKVGYGFWIEIERRGGRHYCSA